MRKPKIENGTKAYWFEWTHHLVIPNCDYEYYGLRNPCMMKVIKRARGWMPLDRKSWFGKIPLPVKQSG